MRSSYHFWIEGEDEEGSCSSSSSDEIVNELSSPQSIVTLEVTSDDEELHNEGHVVVKQECEEDVYEGDGDPYPCQNIKVEEGLPLIEDSAVQNLEANCASASAVSAPRVPKPKGVKRFKCPNCQYRAISRDGIRTHNRVHTGEKPFPCTLCNFRSSSVSALEEHKRIHSGEKPYKCELCDYRTASSANLGKHNRMHSGAKPHHCAVCDFRTAHAFSLKAHMRRHSGVKPFQCPDCGFRTADSSSVRRHIMTVHTNCRPHRCSKCDYSSVTAYHLKLHMRAHTGERPFQCTECRYRTVDSTTLKKHRRTHFVKN